MQIHANITLKSVIMVTTFSFLGHQKIIKPVFQFNLSWWLDRRSNEANGSARRSAMLSGVIVALYPLFWSYFLLVLIEIKKVDNAVNDFLIT